MGQPCVAGHRLLRMVVNGVSQFVFVANRLLLEKARRLVRIRGGFTPVPLVDLVDSCDVALVLAGFKATNFRRVGLKL